MFRQNMSTYVLQNILWHLDTDEIVTDLMDAVSLVANVSQKMIYRRRESIKQDIGEKYTELWSRQTPITGKLFGMSCLVLTMADSLMSSSTESTGCSYEWLSGCIVNGTSMSGCCTVSGTAIAGYGMGSGTSMPGCCMVNGTSIPGCCIVNVCRWLAVVWLMVHRCLAVAWLAVHLCLTVVWLTVRRCLAVRLYC
jgi:hypothetical protein